ncbi:hypothetical protein [Brevibacillus centrosporus]|uniref:hypothetical protein n=1 Tax=Brevibacillus centrosporus TaxID=54910 RepID=UPI00111460F4|nr:hypothetical protein [Brevibacillus centrosporus]
MRRPVVLLAMICVLLASCSTQTAMPQAASKVTQADASSEAPELPAKAAAPASTGEDIRATPQSGALSFKLKSKKHSRSYLPAVFFYEREAEMTHSRISR